jgi:hypothetical protein
MNNLLPPSSFLTLGQVGDVRWMMDDVRWLMDDVRCMMDEG